jgi:hypothetical protein
MARIEDMTGTEVLTALKGTGTEVATTGTGDLIVSGTEDPAM